MRKVTEAPAARATKLDPVTGLPPVGSARRPEPPVDLQGIPRVAVTREEAARSLGMSLDSFERHVQPDVRMIRRGKMRLVPVAELQRWADTQAERALG